MAIAFDATTAITTGTTATLTYSHTCTGSNGILWVGVSIRNTRSISSVTYNGVSMTQSGSSATSDGNLAFLFYLIGPKTGANTVSITQSVSDKIVSSSTSFTGVLQSGQPDATSTGSQAASTSYSQSVTTIADNCWAIMWGMATSALAITAGSNTTVRAQPESFFTGGFMIDTNSAKTPAGTDTMNVTSSAQNYAGAMASFSPSVPVQPLAIKF
jgi:hypothetical protein